MTETNQPTKISTIVKHRSSLWRQSTISGVKSWPLNFVTISCKLNKWKNHVRIHSKWAIHTVWKCCQIISNCLFTCLAAGASLNTSNCPSVEKTGIYLDNPCKPFGVYRQTFLRNWNIISTLRCFFLIRHCQSICRNPEVKYLFKTFQET